MPFEIDISDTSKPILDVDRLVTSLQRGLELEGVESAILSVSIVDNATIHDLNRQHLQHDYPTDVISFQLDWSCDGVTLEQRLQQPDGRSQDASIEGEIIVSSEYAAEMASECGWSTEDELTLYAVHGMLHICGYDDLTASEKKFMRARERAILNDLGLTPIYPHDEPPPESSSAEVSDTPAEDSQ